MKQELEKKHQVKTHVLGPDEGQQQQIKILNSIVSRNGSKRIVYEADRRHAEIVIEQLNLGDATEVTTPGTRQEGRTTADHEDKLGEKDVTGYRAIVARLNYLTLARPDIAYAVKELARATSSPSKGDWLRLRSPRRYIKGRPRVQQVYGWQPTQQLITTCSDADWVGCRQMRKYTTGGCIMIGKHTTNGWSTSQALVALSSGESELHVALKPVAETSGLMSMLKGLNWQMGGQVHGDASAAPGVTNRTGLGKTRHIDTSLLWIQQAAAERQLHSTNFWARAIQRIYAPKIWTCMPAMDTWKPSTTTLPQAEFPRLLTFMMLVVHVYNTRRQASIGIWNCYKQLQGQDEKLAY